MIFIFEQVFHYIMLPQIISNHNEKSATLIFIDILFIQLQKAVPWMEIQCGLHGMYKIIMKTL